MVGSLKIVSNVSRFKPALNLNRVLADLNRGSNSLNSISGSTPPVLLAAIRGYFLVVEVFKQFNTDFLVENKFQQSILHVVLKAGYYNKVRFTLII